MAHRCSISALTIAFCLASSAWAQPRPTFQEPQHIAPDPPVAVKTPQPRDPVLPINLPTALKLVNARAMDVAIASQRIAQADAQLRQAKAVWLPNVTIGADYLRHVGRVQDVAGTIINPHRASFMTGMGVNAVFTPADAIFGPLAARQVMRSRVADHEATTNNSVLAVAEAYFNMQQARGELAGLEVAAAHAEELVKRTEKLAAGIAPPTEHVRARADLAARKQRVNLAVERWRLASADLSRILRLDAATLVEPMEPPHLRVALVPADQSLDTLIAMGLRNRPELASQQALVEATLQRLRQEKLRPLIPSLALRGAGTNPPASFSMGVFGGGNDALGTYGLRTDVELQVGWEFQNLLFGNTAKIKERRVENEIAVLEMFRMQDRVAAEVAQAHAQIQSASVRLADAESGLKDATDSVEKNFSGLKQTRLVGDVMILIVRPQEVLQSIQALSQAYGDYFGAIGDYNRAQYRLYRALGLPGHVINGFECPPPVTTDISPSRPD